MIASLRLALSLFTVAPIRRQYPDPAARAGAALLWLPVLGGLLGALAALPLAAVRQWASHAEFLAAIGAITLLALGTRGLHLDGLADTADGLGSRASTDRALTIMRQSDIGPFGVITIVLVVLAEAAAVSELRGDSWTPVLGLGLAAATGRVAAVQAAVRGVPSARPEGFGALVAGRVAPIVALAYAAGVLALGLLISLARGWAPWWCLAQALGLAVAFALRVHTTRRFGGVSGDVFGAVIEVGTVITLAGMCLR